MSESSDRAVPPLALCLSYAGLLPFVGLAGLLWAAPAAWSPIAAKALLVYGALIASFLGGIHWSIAQRDASPAASRRYLWGVTPSLLAWIAALLPVTDGLILVGVLLMGCYAVDRSTYGRCGLVHWLPLRMQLTVVAVLSCLAGAWALH